MVSSMQLPQEAARLWGNALTRNRILEMHANNVPLLDMVDELGLTQALDADGLRTVIENLNDGEIQAIRDVFVAEAKAAGDHSGANFPVDCRTLTPGDKVHVTMIPARSAAVTPVVRIDTA
jgi:hypothetical protein